MYYNCIGTYEIAHYEGGFAEGDEVPLFYIEIVFYDKIDYNGDSNMSYNIYERFMQDGSLMQLGFQKRVN